MDQARSFQKKAFETVEKTPMKRFDTDGFDLPVIFLSAYMKKEMSKTQKCAFAIGNLAGVHLTEKAKAFVTDKGDGTLTVVPNYVEGIDRTWPGLAKKHPISLSDAIHLGSFTIVTVAAPPALAQSLSPGDIVTLVDVRYQVFVPRRGLPEGVKLVDMSPDQLAWSEDELRACRPIFHFSAAHFKPSPHRVSLQTELAMYDAAGFLNRQVEKFVPYHLRERTDPQDDYSEGPTGADGEPVEGEVIFRNEYLYTHEAKRVDFVPYDASSNPEEGAEVVLSRDGTRGNQFDMIPVPDNLIAERQKSDRMSFESIKSRKEMDKMVKAWSFVVTGRQVEYASIDPKAAETEGLSPDDIEDMGGMDMREGHAVLDQFFQAKFSIYSNVIERDFGIVEKSAWTRFMSVYNPFFAGIFQATVDADKTERREVDLEVMNSGVVGAGVSNDVGSRMYDFAIAYRCEGVLFDMPEWIRRIGVPVSDGVANKLLDKMASKREGSGSTKDIRNLSTYKKQSVACLNEVQGIDTCKAYVGHDDAQVYMVLMPPKLNKARFGWIERITTDEVGDQLAHISVLNQERYDESKHSKDIAKLQEYLKDEEEETLFPLLFLVCNPRPGLYDNEMVPVSKFMGLSSPESARAFLFGNAEEGVMKVEDVKPEVEVEEVPSLEPSQAIPGSMEEEATFDPPEEIESEDKKRKGVTFGKGTKAASEVGSKRPKLRRTRMR
jgi:hypothetical protein